MSKNNPNKEDKQNLSNVPLNFFFDYIKIRSTLFPFLKNHIHNWLKSTGEYSSKCELHCLIHGETHRQRFEITKVVASTKMLNIVREYSFATEADMVT